MIRMFEARLKVYSSATTDFLRDYMESRNDIPQQLRSSMLYSLMAGGKRLRPALCMASCEMLGKERVNALPFAAALEMIHTYSLIHDDLPAMDNDDFRRGKPSNHKAFGEAMAILAGDALLNTAFELASFNCKTVDDIKAMQYLAKAAGASGMIAGQVMDIDAENEVYPSPDPSESLVMIHEKKTGELLTVGIMCGAIIAGADEQTLTALKRFGLKFGLLFQITDDVLDAVGDFKSLGKTIGKDNATSKLTYVSLYGVDEAREKASAIAEDAKRTLGELPYDTSFFSGLMDFTLSRTW